MSGLGVGTHHRAADIRDRASSLLAPNVAGVSPIFAPDTGGDFRRAEAQDNIVFDGQLQGWLIVNAEVGVTVMTWGMEREHSRVHEDS